MPTVSVKYITDSGEIIEETYEIKENEVLFEALDDKGLTLPHGCLAGSCGSCRMIVLEGNENLSPPGIIETDTLNDLKIEYQDNEYMKNKTIRLACRVKVLGNVKITTILKKI